MRTLLLSGAFLVLTAGAALAAQDRCACCEDRAQTEAAVADAEAMACCCERMQHNEDQSGHQGHEGHDAPAEPTTPAT